MQKRKNPINEVAKGLDKIDQNFRDGMGKILNFSKKTKKVKING